MARKAVERNIAYDDQRKLYYVSMELGRDENGKRIKQYRTFPTLAAARNGLRDFHAGIEREREQAQKLAPAQELEYNPTDHVILDAKGMPYSPNALSLAFTRFVKKNDRPRLTFHGLRHTFATIASCQGASLFDIGKALGHSTPATTGRIYTHLVDRTHEDLVLRVSDALK